MRFYAKVTPEYIRQGTGDLCYYLKVKLTPTNHGQHTIVDGSIPALISFFTALANHYMLSLKEIRDKFA